jgi:23S rRNA pseudouridine2605 synthase
MNKPVGYVTTVKEQLGRPCVTDIIKENIRVYPVGRLDMDTSGLLILTNDGELTNKITHPKNHIYKTYEVTTYKKVENEDVIKLKNGVDIGEYITAPAIVKKISDAKFEISIHEGKNRQVRKMIEAIDNKVKTLNRIKIGGLYLRKLKQGEYIYVNKAFIEKVFK